LARLQTDYLSIPARQLVPLLASVHSSNEATESARRLLLSWNYVLDTASVAAGIYEAWLRRLNANMRQRVVPAPAQPFLRAISTKRLIDWLRT
jgi:penicillin amidase